MVPVHAQLIMESMPVAENDRTWLLTDTRLGSPNCFLCLPKNSTFVHFREYALEAVFVSVVLVVRSKQGALPVKASRQPATKGYTKPYNEEAKVVTFILCTEVRVLSRLCWKGGVSGL